MEIHSAEYQQQEEGTGVETKLYKDELSTNERNIWNLKCVMADEEGK